MDLVQPLPDKFLYRCPLCGKEEPTDAIPRNQLGPPPVRCPRCGAGSENAQVARPDMKAILEQQ